MVSKLLNIALVCALVSLVAWGICLRPIEAKERVRKSRSSFRIGFIRDRNLVEGCGCGFTLPNELKRKAPRFIITSNVEEMNKAWMNIDGRDVELGLMEMTYGDRGEKVGSRSTERFAGSGIEVSATLVVSRICEPDDEDCESTDYLGTFVVRKGRQKQTMRLTGSCGC